MHGVKGGRRFGRSGAAAALVATVAVLLLVAGGTTSAADPRPGTAGTDGSTRLLSLDARGRTGPLPADPATLVGADGQLYERAPIVVSGTNGPLFYGPDFDAACADGPRFRAGLRKLALLARVIERSGRRVVWTVAPNKSSVYDADVVQDGMAKQERVMDDFDDPTYLPLRRLLAGDPRRVYYNTDSHWTSVGASVYASRLADRLDESVAERQQYALGEEEHQGDLYSLLGIPLPEVAPTAKPLVGVTVRIPPPTGAYLQQRWNAGPPSRVMGGTTVIVGDSFSYVALGNVRPLFRHGTFIWIVPENLESIAQGMAASDTVVIEVLQRLVSTSALATGAFRRQVRAALAAAG